MILHLSVHVARTRATHTWESLHSSRPNAWILVNLFLTGYWSQGEKMEWGILSDVLQQVFIVALLHDVEVILKGSLHLQWKFTILFLIVMQVFREKK